MLYSEDEAMRVKEFIINYPAESHDFVPFQEDERVKNLVVIELNLDHA